MIHVCFALYDKTGNYSRFTGTAMLSLFDNTKSKVTVHLLHDNTLTNDNREKLIQIADRYGHPLKFYNVEELCADQLAKIEEHLPQAKESHFSIAMFYRFFIPHLLYPQGIEKAIYLDSDIIFNLDILELWQFELDDKPFGAITRASQFKEEGVSSTSKIISIVREGVVKPEDYFHSGLLLMNLKVLRKEEDTILMGIKFVGEHPQYIYIDQDILNYCFSTTFLKLPVKLNRVVLFARSEDELSIEKKIYHYANLRGSLGLYINDPYNQLFMDHFIKTPWIDADTAAVLSGNLPSRKNYSISVVIPLYNMEEYISECLDSLLLQTFQDFEVIVVDDCSTDNSFAIVEEYTPKFNGRLRLTQTEKNSGGGGYVPRNIGIMLARGEYIQFLDSDDMLLGNALEALYKAAIIYDADVVYTSSYYRLNAPDDIYLYKDGTTKKMITIQTDLNVNDLNKNLSRLLLESGEGNFHSCWTKFVRREFLAKNRILFSYLPNAGDLIWSIEVYCHAKNFLRISTPLYLYRRYNNHSILRIVREPQEQCRYWFSSFVEFANRLHELEKNNEVLAANPLYCLAVLNKHFSWCLNRTESARKEFTNEEIYKFLRDEFSNITSNSVSVLSPFFFSLIDNEKRINANQARLIKNYAEPLNKFRQYFTAKILIVINKKTDRETIQLLSVSDEKAKLAKPAWWQRNGTAHMIDSYTGKLEIVAKAIVEGNVQIRLGGPWVQNPKDKSKRLPYWIDYTKLTVNDKVIFDTITSAWHDKHYIYNLKVNAEEEINIQIEWLPHIDNRLDISSNVSAEKTDTQTDRLPRRSDTIEQKVTPTPEIIDSKPKITPPPVKPAPKEVTPKLETQKNAIPESKPVAPLSKYDSARIDVKFVSDVSHIPKSKFKIFSISDDNADVTKPDWLQRSGTGYVIQSLNGELTFIAKATTKGRIELKLRGISVRSRESSHSHKGTIKHIPYWVDYTSLIVNEKNIFNAITPAWYDEPYKYSLNVEGNEEVVIKIKWQPHKSQ